MDELDFCQNPQKPIFLGHFFLLFGFSWLDRIFFFKLTFFKFVSLWLSIFIQKLEKTDDLILRSCVWYGRTDGQSQINRSLLLMQVFNNYQLKIMVHARNRNVPPCQNQSDIQLLDKFIYKYFKLYRISRFIFQTTDLYFNQVFFLQENT